MRREWQRYAAQAEQVMEALERWRESFDEVRPLDLASLIVDYRPLTGELATRFWRIEPMLSGQDSDPRPPAHVISLNMEGVRALSHFERAALALFDTQLRNLESLTRGILDTLARIRGSSTPELRPVVPAEPARALPHVVLDPDGFAAAVRCTGSSARTSSRT
jgi:hypothetical protein